MKNISQVKKRILQIIDLKGISKSEFYRKTSITRGVLDHETGLSEDNITKFIASYPDINIIWLLTGRGEIGAKEEPAHEKNKQKDTNNITLNDSLLDQINRLTNIIDKQQDTIKTLTEINKKITVSAKIGG